MSRVIIYCVTAELESLAALKASEEAAGNRVAFINSAAFNPAQLENADKVFVHERDVDRISPSYLARKTEVAVIEEQDQGGADVLPPSQPDSRPDSKPAPAKPPRKAQTAGSHKPRKAK